MAKDILVDTQTGDLQFSENSLQTTAWDVVWGKLFDTDEAEYMNIVVPSGYINNIQYSNNVFECAVQASYYPINSSFLARLVVENVASKSYNPISSYNLLAPTPLIVMYYPTYIGDLRTITPCQLPLVDIDGEFKIVFNRYNNNSLSYAAIYSSKSEDLSVGVSDSQSAQLLARCAPGKYYRYPTTGLDLTKYINSVVEHTNMTSELVSQFKSDSKQITEASFDSKTGDLQIIFSGSNEAEDDNLIEPELLDVSLFKLADDDFVRAMYRKAQSIIENGEEFINGFVGLDFFGIYDIGASAALSAITPSIQSGKLLADGAVVDNSEYYIGVQKIESGKIYAISYPSSIINNYKDGVYSHDCLFALFDGDNLIYADEPFIAGKDEYESYIETFENRRCFIATKDLTLKCYAGKTSTWLNETEYGIRPLVDSSDNYSSILGLCENQESGVWTGMVSNFSSIEGVRIDIETNRTLIIKQSI